MRLPGLFLILPIIVIGIIGTVVAVIGRQSSDTEFVFRQQNLTPVTPAVLARFVASARDPRPGNGRHRGLRARCFSQGAGELRNPWSCTVIYPVGPRVQYRVVIDPSGQVHGINSDGSLSVEGCCVGYVPAS
jgi:hypothetical protein